MTQFTIREAALADLDPLLGFEQAIVAAERAFDPTLAAENVTYYDLRAMLGAPDVRLLVAEHDGQLIGSGYARLEAAKPCLRHRQHAYLGFMYVVPAHRGAGVNRQLIEALAQWAAARGVHELRLEVYHQNLPALRAYEKVGFASHMVEMRRELPR